MRAKAVLPQVDPLPGAEHEAAVATGMDSWTAVSAARTCAGMSSGALVAMAEERIAIGQQPGEEAIEVGAHIRVGVLLDERGLPTCGG